MPQSNQDPQSPTAVLSRISAVCPNVERLKQKLDRMYFKSNNPKPCVYTGISYILEQLINYQNSFKTKQDGKHN